MCVLSDCHTNATVEQRSVVDVEIERRRRGEEDALVGGISTTSDELAVDTHISSACDVVALHTCHHQWWLKFTARSDSKEEETRITLP